MSPNRMSPEAVIRRLREMSERSNLSAALRLATKVDMSPEAVTRRLRTQSMLRDACLAWGRRGAGGLGPADGASRPPRTS